MTFLVDTHVVLWLLAEPERLEDRVLDALADPATEVLLSSASVWEIAIKVAAGKVNVESDLVDAAAAAGLRPLPITHEHAQVAGQLPPHHRDPFDRMLVAQAQAERATLVTSDHRLAAYEVSILPA